ncbi:MAG: hypothetical protein H6845_01155 [Alphaproteobacteria bacterium]|nr:MAG: hypothetical protein H6845_01155 [Alphaproteobacteria bacterium]
MHEEYNYKGKLQEYLRLMVRDILRHVTQYGLQGSQHFYIAFSMDHPNVSLPAFLRKQYPTSMTIVLHNHFDNLQIFQQSFSVDLSFADEIHKITVPFNAITYITDPSANFALEFKADTAEIPNLDSVEKQDNIIYFPSVEPR